MATLKPHGRREETWSTAQYTRADSQFRAIEALTKGLKAVLKAQDMKTARTLMHSLGQSICTIQRETRPGGLSLK